MSVITGKQVIASVGAGSGNGNGLGRGLSVKSAIKTVQERNIIVLRFVHFWVVWVFRCKYTNITEMSAIAITTNSGIIQ